MSKHKAKKHLGQNFITDPLLIDKIINAAKFQSDDSIVEIGPGQGALTKAILTFNGKVDVIEFDADIIPILKNNCQKLGKLIIHHADVLNFDFTSLASIYKQPLKIIGNLPYNISSPLIFHLLDCIDNIKDMHFMLQKEVVARICAKPNNKQYGRLSVMIQYFCQAEALFVVPPEAFDPMPKVDSQIIRLTPKEKKHVLKDYPVFSEIVKAAFQQRRKTIRNALKNYACDNHFMIANISPGLRAENLSVENYISLSNAIKDHPWQAM